MMITRMMRLIGFGIYMYVGRARKYTGFTEWVKSSGAFNGVGGTGGPSPLRNLRNFLSQIA